VEQDGAKVSTISDFQQERIFVHGELTAQTSLIPLMKSASTRTRFGCSGPTQQLIFDGIDRTDLPDRGRIRRASSSSARIRIEGYAAKTHTQPLGATPKIKA